MKTKLFFRERKRQKRAGYEHLRCNLCQRMFRAPTKYHRFCRACKTDEEIFRFYEWLPIPGLI